jgi:hypothetical protein
MYYGSLTHSILGQLFLANVGLVVFNMIPAFPMDGGRVLRAFLALFMNHVRATEAAVMTSRFVAFLFIASPFLPGVLAPFNPRIAEYLSQNTSPVLAIIGLFLLFVGSQELAYARRQQMVRAYEREFAKSANPAERFVTVDAHAPPNWNGFTWDPSAGGWIQWRTGQPISAVSGPAPGASQ